MPSRNRLALLVTGFYVVAVLLWGFLIAVQPLLAIFLALLGVFAYFAWRIFGSSR